MPNNTTASGGVNLAENEHVKELLNILKDNGKDATGLSALLNHVNEMENFVKQAENRIADMKSQLDSMKEIQNHPVKTALKNAIKSLEAKVAAIKEHLTELKNNIIEGCKNAVATFKEKGAAVLDKLMSFFHIKKGLQAIKNNAVTGMDKCDKSMEKIAAFSKEYHATGRHLKNMARVMLGKEPLDKVKESGKLAKVVSTPYKAHKACLRSIQRATESMINKLENFQENVAAKRKEKSVVKKPTLTERLKTNKELIKQKELEMPKLDRKKVTGLEV